MYFSTEWGLNDVVNLQNENKKLIGLSVATHTDYVKLLLGNQVVTQGQFLIFFCIGHCLRAFQQCSIVVKLGGLGKK